MINMITNKNYKNQYVYLVEGRVFTNKEQAINYAKENDKEKVVERLALNVDGDCLTESKDKVIWKSTSNIKRLNESLNNNNINEDYDFDDDEIVDDDDYIHTNYDNEIEIEVEEDPDVKWAGIKPYLNIVLEDDDTSEGGTSFAGETFGDFLMDSNLTDQEIIDMSNEDWNNLLKDNGIKPIFPKKEESLKEDAPYYPNQVDNLNKEQFIHTLVNHWGFTEDVATKIANQLDDKQIYVCTQDFQGGDFGVGRKQNELDWVITALEWGDVDDLFEDYDDELFLKVFKDGEIIDWICDMWEIEIKPIEELTDEDKEVLSYYDESLKESKTDNTDKKELLVPPFQIKVWETKEDRDQGEPYICNYFDRNSIEKAIKTADRLFKDSESVEVYNKNGDIVYGLYNDDEEDTDEALKESEDSDIKKYKVTLKHDKGKVNIKTTASSKEQAIKQVLDIEKAPESAVVKCEVIESIKESKNNEWENYGDINFLTYGGTLLKEVAPQEYEIIRLFTPWGGTKEGEYVLGTCYLNTKDYEDSIDDISKFTGEDYSGLDKDKWFAVDLVDYYGTYQLGGTDEVLTKDEVIEALKDKGVDIDTLGSFEESLKEGIDYNYQLRDGYEALDKANINFNVEEDTFEFNDNEDTQKAFGVLSKVYGRDNVNVISAFKLKVDIEGFSGDEGRYIEEDYKQVYDSDGFLTDYTMYFDTLENRYVFVFGDNEIYKPEDGDFDWECESEEEAREWFDNYRGFDEEEDFDESLKEDTVKTKDGKWTNKGKEGTHGTFKTKKQADAQRKAMFANGYKEDLNKNLSKSIDDLFIDSYTNEYPIDEDYFLFIEGLTENGEGCDSVYEEFSKDNIDHYLVDIVSVGEGEQLESLDTFEKGTLLKDIVKEAKKVIIDRTNESLNENDNEDNLDSKIKNIYDKYIEGGTFNIKTLTEYKPTNKFIVPVKSKNFDEGKPSLDEFSKYFKDFIEKYGNNNKYVIGTYHNNETGRYSIDVSELHDSSNFNIKNNVNDEDEAIGYLDNSSDYADVKNPYFKKRGENK